MNNKRTARILRRSSLAAITTAAVLLRFFAPGTIYAQSSATSAATVPGCRNDQLNPYIKARVTDVFTSGHPDDVNRRSRSRLPGALPGDVVQITADSVVCRWARGVHNATLPTGYSASADVFVFSVRGVYVVIDPKPGKHYMSWTFFSANGTVLAKIAT